MEIHVENYSVIFEKTCFKTITGYKLLRCLKMIYNLFDDKLVNNRRILLIFSQLIVLLLFYIP